MRFDIRRPELLPGARVTAPPLLRMMPSAVSQRSPAPLLGGGEPHAPRPSAVPSLLSIPPPRQIRPLLPPTSPPLLAVPQPQQSAGMVLVPRHPPPQQLQPLLPRPSHLPLPVPGSGTAAASLPLPVHPHPHVPSGVPVPLSAVAGPPPGLLPQARWTAAPTVELFNPLVPPPTDHSAAAQFASRLPLPPMAADIGGGLHSGLPSVTVMHALPVNYSVPLATVPLPASVPQQLSYVTMTTAQTVTSPQTPADVMMVQYSDMYGRQQSYESVQLQSAGHSGHVQSVRSMPSPESRSSSRHLTTAHHDAAAAAAAAAAAGPAEHRHKRRAPSTPERERDHEREREHESASLVTYQRDESPKKHKTERHIVTLTDKEFDDILQRNKNVSSGAIMRAVQDASEGDFPLAIETLVTAISLIKQSKIAADDRCKILISSLQDTLHGIESKSYGSKSSSGRGSSDRRSRSRDRDRDRSSVQESSSRQKSPTSYKYRSSAAAATAAEPRERRHYDALPSSASSSSSFDKRRSSDKLERDRGDRSGAVISENDVVRERGRERERDRERDRQRERERGGDGDYVSRSSRR